MHVFLKLDSDKYYQCQFRIRTGREKLSLLVIKGIFFMHIFLKISNDKYYQCRFEIQVEIKIITVGY